MDRSVRKLCIQVLAGARARPVKSTKVLARARGPREKSGQRVKVEEEEREIERERGAKGSEKVEKQNAALKVDGVSCYVLLSTLGRSPISTYLFSSVDGRE